MNQTFKPDLICKFDLCWVSQAVKHNNVPPPKKSTFNWLPTCNLIMYWKLKVSLKTSHSESLDDIQGIIPQFKMISNKVPRHGNICVHGQYAYFQNMEDGICLNLRENCHPPCSINTRISTWHVIVVYITVFSSISDKWYWCWLVRELLLQEHTYLHFYSVRVRLLENTMQNKVMHITVLFPTIKWLTTKFLHYTYYYLNYIVYHFSSKLQNKQYHIRWKWYTHENSSWRSSAASVSPLDVFPCNMTM